MVIWIVIFFVMLVLMIFICYFCMGCVCCVCVEDLKMVSLFGINIDWVIVLIFVIGAVMAVVVGVLFG